jgi:hypothetical protein
MRVRALLFAYCLLALVGLTVWMLLLAGQIQVAQASAREALEQHAVAQGAYNRGSEYLKALTMKQRESRLEATAQDAIELSATIQQLQQSIDEARSAEQRSQALAEVIQARARRLQLGFVPLIALLIAHIVGAFVFFPRRIA